MNKGVEETFAVTMRNEFVDVEEFKLLMILPLPSAGKLILFRTRRQNRIQT